MRVLLGEGSVSKTEKRGSNPRAHACGSSNSHSRVRAGVHHLIPTKWPLSVTVHSWLLISLDVGSTPQEATGEYNK